MKKILLSILLTSYTQAFNHLDLGWLKLLRYQKTILGDYQSEVDSKDFFVHPDGKNSPKKELDEFLKKIKKEKDLKNIDTHPICLFPARASYLEKKYNIPLVIEPASCPKVKELIEKLNISNISLVFSSYFIEKPASAFGHTFLKISTNEAKSEENDFLDYAVDFSAQVTTKNPILYGIMGIFGGFKGKFSLMPYYVKIKEYNDMESRDLWDFKLNFDKNDLSFFVMHLFEMNLAYFDYYYFRENCSYHVLGLIDAIKPDWQLTDKLKFFVPPIDTLHALNNKNNIVKSINFRASKYQSLKSRSESLSPIEKIIYKQTSENESVLYEGNDYTKMSDQERANLLEYLSDYIDFKYASELGSKDSKSYKDILAKKFSINELRSEINAESQKLDYSKIIKYNSPLDGHSSKRIKLSAGYNDELASSYAEFEYRFSLHDYLDNKIGHIPFSTSELGKLKLQYLQEFKKLKIKEFSIVNVEAIRPKTLFSKSLSWIFTTGLRDENLTPKNSYFAFMNFSLGSAFQIKNLTATLLLATENNFSITNKAYNNYLGPQVLVVHNSGKINFSLKSDYLYDTFDSHKFKGRIKTEIRRPLTLNSAINLELAKTESASPVFSLGYLRNF